MRIGGHAVLIGVTADRINQLLQIDDPEEVDRLAQLPPADEGRSFRSLAGMLSGTMLRSAAPRGAARAGGARSAPSLGALLGGAGGRLAGLGWRLAGVPRPALRPAAGAPGAPPRPRSPYAGGAAAPRPAPAPARTGDDGWLDATPPAAAALRARSGYRGSQINDLQRAIAQARAGVNFDRFEPPVERRAR